MKLASSFLQNESLKRILIPNLVGYAIAMVPVILLIETKELQVTTNLSPILLISIAGILIWIVLEIIRWRSRRAWIMALSGVLVSSATSVVLSIAGFSIMSSPIDQSFYWGIGLLLAIFALIALDTLNPKQKDIWKEHYQKPGMIDFESGSLLAKSRTSINASQNAFSLNWIKGLLIIVILLMIRNLQSSDIFVISLLSVASVYWFIVCRWIISAIVIREIELTKNSPKT